jgi:hypothetical protein
MPRKHRKKRQHQATQPGSSPENRPFSPVAQAVVEKIALGGANYLESNFVRIMLDSYALAKEPEFTDLFFDEEKVIPVTGKFMKKYTKRLEVAARKGQDEQQQVMDQMRIEIIDELATPLFRKEVKHRLKLMSERLMATSEKKKLEIAFLLEPILSMKEIPWGVCGLVIAIYSRTFEQTLQEYEQEKEFFGELSKMLEGGNPADILAYIEDPEKSAAIVEKLKAKPELHRRLENQLQKEVDEFEEALWKGRLKMDLFTEEELLSSFIHLQEIIEADQVDLSTADRKQVTVMFADILRQSIVEIMTPERIMRMKADLDKIFKRWLREKNRWAVAIQAETYWLDEIEVVDNRFLFAVYVSQVRRVMEAHVSESKHHDS